MRLQGTFLVRPSLSLAGAMVLSVVVNGAVKHMALDGNQLDTRSLEVRLIRLLPSACPHATPHHDRACMLTCEPSGPTDSASESSSLVSATCGEGVLIACMAVVRGGNAWKSRSHWGEAVQQEVA